MKRTIFYVSVIFTLLLAILSCRKIEKLSDVPEIKFTSFTVIDTTDILGNSYKGGKLKFYFEDGDGDVGLYDISPDERDYYDSLGYVIDTTNLFFTLYKKVDGQFVKADDDDILNPEDCRIPYIENKSQVKLLKGDIIVVFLYQFYNVASCDTIKYEFYLKDRKYNVSNTETTCEIPLSFNAVYE